MTSIKFYKSMEDINTVRWKMNELANACKTLGLGDFAAILKAMSDDLDDVVDSLTETLGDLMKMESENGGAA